jgi:hypothetical protein
LTKSKGPTDGGISDASKKTLLVGYLNFPGLILTPRDCFLCGTGRTFHILKVVYDYDYDDDDDDGDAE